MDASGHFYEATVKGDGAAKEEFDTLASGLFFLGARHGYPVLFWKSRD
ncbi:MAG TPA: hypothetical protein VIX19_17770 [Terriglobales bacterium]